MRLAGVESQLITTRALPQVNFMHTTLLQMTLLMLCGTVWRVLKPNGLSAEQTRLVLTSSVYYFFLPAMVLEVLWTSDLGWQSLQYTALGWSTVLAALALCWLFCKLFKLSNGKTGALLLAAAFPNVTYLGLPVLEQTFGSWARSVVIQMDLFAVTPLLFTLGISLAKYYGTAADDHQPKHPLVFLNAPPFWAAGLAVLLNLNQIPAPVVLLGLLQKCSAAVAPIMIFSLGLALSPRSLRWHTLPVLIPVLLIKLAFMPWLAIYCGQFLTLASHLQAAAVLDLAMPSMVLGIMLCDRFKLDSSLYASAVVLTTACSLFSLGFWHQHL